MPRTARRKSETGIYHLILRGINRQAVFNDEEDIQRFLETLQKIQTESCFSIYAYCFMVNHVHLLMHEGVESLSNAMRRLGSSYVYWYNRKYDRTGYLFQDRYKSEPVHNDSYLLTVLRYIHHNPLKANLVNTVDQYKWSSYKDYVTGKGFSDIDFVLDLFHDDRERALKAFESFHDKKNDDRCIDLDNSLRPTDKEATEIICKLCSIKSPAELKKKNRTERNQFLKQLKDDHNISVRQIQRLTGINRGLAYKA